MKPIKERFMAWLEWRRLPEWVKKPRFELSPQEAELYKSLAPVLYKQGRLNFLTAYTLTFYCANLELARIAREEIAKGAKHAELLEQTAREDENTAVEIGLDYFNIWPEETRKRINSEVSDDRE